MKIKSIFLILFLIPSLAMADYYFTVENTTMVDTYFNIFNAIASLFKNDSYIELLRLIFLLGGFFVFAGGVLSAWETNGSGKVLAPYAKYTLVGVALLTFMFSQKENMWVTTNNIPSFCSTGSHTTGTAVQMPAVLAYFFSVTNRLGTSLTYMAESAFNTPNANGTAAMSDSNGYLGSLKETLRLLSFNPNQVTFSTGLGAHMQYGHIDFLSMWQNFFAKCVYDVAQNKGITGDNVINGLVASNNIPLWLDNYMGTNPFLAESPGYPPSENLIVINGEHTTCGTYYQFLKDNVNPKLTDNYACAFPFTNAGVLELITGNSGGIVSELNGIALQSGLINALGSSKVMTSIGISGADFASGKSRAESNQENLATAQYMAQMLPYLQMTMRAVLYAFFPFVFITVLLPGGLKVLGQYAQTLIWIELWGPTAAIVNMFVNMQVKAEVATKYNEIGLTYMSSIDMLGEANTIAGVGAMLYLSIPALTWLIISGSGQMLGNLASGVSGKFSKNLESASVAQDMANIQKQQEVNARRQAEGMKALSYGEQMHYEANMKGMKEAGSMIAAMNTGLQSVANASQYSDLSSYKTAQNKIAFAGMEGGTSIEAYESELNLRKQAGVQEKNSMKDIVNSDVLNNTTTIQTNKDKIISGGGLDGAVDVSKNKEMANFEAEKLIQKHLGINDRAGATAINEMFQNSKTQEQFKNDFKSAMKQAKIAGEKDLTDNEIEGMYQKLQNHKNRVEAGTYDRNKSAEQNLDKINKLGDGDVVVASKREALAEARKQESSTVAEEFKEKYYDFNTEGNLNAQQATTGFKTTEELNKRTGSVDDSINRVSKADAFEKEQSIVTTETKEKSFNAKDYGVTKGQEEVGEQYQNTRQQNETSKAAMKELTKPENIQHLYNSSIEHSMNNDKDAQKWRRIKDNAKWHTNQDIEAAEKGLAERENTYRVANAIAIADTVPLTEAGVNVLKQGLKGTGAEKEFNDILKAANMEKGNFDSFSNQELYNEVRYLNGGKSILTNDLSGNTVNTMNTNVLNNITQHSTSRSLGHSMDVRTNASGFVERNVMKGNLSEIHAWMIGGTTSIAKNAVIGAGLRNLTRDKSKK